MTRRPHSKGSRLWSATGKGCDGDEAVNATQNSYQTLTKATTTSTSVSSHQASPTVCSRETRSRTAGRKEWDGDEENLEKSPICGRHVLPEQLRRSGLHRLRERQRDGARYVFGESSRILAQTSSDMQETTLSILVAGQLDGRPRGDQTLGAPADPEHIVQMLYGCVMKPSEFNSYSGKRCKW